jgi:hypothetical protein
MMNQWMKRQLNRKWISDLMFCGLMAIALSACRFGNYSDSPTQVNGVSITHSEYFFTQVATFHTYVYWKDAANPSPSPYQNLNAPLVSVPSDLLDLFTNPVSWNTLSDSQQFFWDVYQSQNPWVVHTDSTGKITTPNNFSPGPDSNTYAQFYHNANCITQIEVDQGGQLDRTHPGAMRLPGASTQTQISGHLSYDFLMFQSIVGDCADDLTELAACYQNGAGCDADQLSRAKMFSLFVDTGTLDIHNAAKIIALAYTVHFE